MKNLLKYTLFIGLVFAKVTGGCENHDFCNICGISPYVGIVGGISSLSGDYTAQTRPTNDKHFATSGGTDGLVGGVGGFQAGFCENGFFALQLNALYNTSRRKVRSSTNAEGVSNHVVNIKNHFQWGLDARIGHMFCGSVAYFLGGFESGKWRMELSNDSTLSNRGIPALSSLTTRRTLWGGKIGGGVTFPILCCLWGNIEYSYTWFGSVKRNLTDSITGLSWRHQAWVRQNSVLFGLNYLF